MTDDEFRDGFGDEIAVALNSRSADPGAAPSPVDVERRARRIHARRRALVATVAVVVAASGAGLIALPNRDHGRFRVATASSSSPSLTASPGHRVVSYRGVHVEVPESWPVVDGMHTGFCEGPFPETPTAFVGPQESAAPSCPAPFPETGRRIPDGVWLQPGDAPGDASPVTNGSGAALLEEKPEPAASILQLWFHHVSIEIGLGPDRSISDAIFDSVDYTAGAPDTVGTGACARDDSGVMPAAERLTEPLVVENGNVTLDPPTPTDEATVPASRVWADSGTKESFEQYRLILARYSARFPATQNAEGTQTPMYHDRLAWVIYSKPNTAIEGCGLYGLDVIDARTGQELEASGYSLGP